MIAWRDEPGCSQDMFCILACILLLRLVRVCKKHIANVFELHLTSAVARLNHRISIKRMHLNLFVIWEFPKIEDPI